MAEDRRLWQRQPGETEKEFLAFEIFRQLGPGRTVDGAFRAYRLRPGDHHKHEGLARDKTPHYFSRWATQFHWWERAKAWDDEVAAAARKEEAERELERRRREAAEDERQRELTIQRARAAGVAAGQILHRLLYTESYVSAHSLRSTAFGGAHCRNCVSTEEMISSRRAK
jgi:hypothetical protein